MLTLTKASKETKLILKWAAIGLAVFFVILLIFKAFVLLKDTLFPAPLPKATVLFGKIEPAAFPASAVNQSFNFSIDTISGELPRLPEQVRVYEMAKTKEDLLALKSLGQKVGKSGFENGPFKISDDLYFWTDNTGDFLRTIRVNINNGNFTMFSPFNFDSHVLTSENLPEANKAKDIAQSFLSQMDYLTDDFDLSKTQINLFSIKDGQLIGATSVSNAQIYKVNFFQKDVNSLHIFYEKPNESNVNVLVAGGSTQPQVIRAVYNLQVPGNKSSTYPIKTSKEAFEDLKKGRAYIASYYGERGNVKLKDIFLAYYISSKEQEQLVPIIVFAGNDGFFAYVSAIKDEWIDK